MALRVAFAGTPAFSIPPLHAIVRAGHELVLVLTQPDRAGGRGMALRPSPVKEAAAALGVPVFQPSSLRAPEAHEPLRAVRPDVLVVVAYGLILPQAVLDIPPRGSFNIHASLLPRWRGAAPIHRAILAGDAETGVGIMRMEAGLDTGPVLLEERTPIGPGETQGELHDRLATLGGRLIVQALALVESGAARAVPQGETGVTYARKIDKSEAVIDWAQPAVAIERQVRAFNPAPGAVTALPDGPLKIWRATCEPGRAGAAPGELLQADRDGIVVACGTGALRIVELQRSGGKRLNAAQFLAGSPIKPGTRFPAVPA